METKSTKEIMKEFDDVHSKRNYHDLRHFIHKHLLAKDEKIRILNKKLEIDIDII